MACHLLPPKHHGLASTIYLILLKIKKKQLLIEKQVPKIIKIHSSFLGHNMYVKQGLK